MGSDPARAAALAEQFARLYDVRSDTIHEGALKVEPAFAFEAMRLGAIAIGYLARSTLRDDAEFHRHLDAMTSRGDVWIDYGYANRLDPGT